MSTKNTPATRHPATRHIISINDLTDREIETVFEVAQSFLRDLPDSHFPYRIGRSTKIASDCILASLFYEPSTRTRLSFESAMLRLGGETITSADPATSSAAKGESLADSVRVIANYADIMVIRHPRDGAVRLAAEFSPIPVINGGDGSHEHPTQTLCDLFPAQEEEQAPQEPQVAISGDLRGSRTIHSFVYALARFGATIMPMVGQGHGAAGARRPAAARGVPLPDGVRQGRWRHDRRALLDAGRAASAVAVLGPELETDIGTRSGKKVDAVYVTPLPERSAGPRRRQAYPEDTTATFSERDRNISRRQRACIPLRARSASSMRAGFDADLRRAVYFEQGSL
jgi:hypothetical protein